MTMILGFIIIYLSIVLGSIFWSSILNKKIETTIAINIGIIVLELYLFSAINLLAQGVYIIATANTVSGYNKNFIIFFINSVMCAFSLDTDKIIVGI